MELGLAGSSNSGVLVAAVVWLLGWCLLYKNVWVPWKNRTFYHKQGVGGPPFRPLIGNVLDIMKIMAAPRHPLSIEENGYSEAVMPHVVAWSKLHDPAGHEAVVFENLSSTVLMVWNPDMIKDFNFAKVGCYKKDMPTKKMLAKFAGLGLVALDYGEFWAQQRKILSGGFSSEFLKAFHHHIVAASKELVQAWQAKVQQGGKDCADILISKHMSDTASKCISYAAFGANIAGSMSVESAAKVFEAVAEQMNLAMNDHYSLKSLIPGHRWFLPQTEAEKKAAREFTLIGKLMEQVVDARVQAVSSRGRQQDGNDLLGLMVDAMLQGSKTMSRQQVMQECRTLFVAGHTTTSQMLTWTLLLLAHHGKWQDRARQEVRELTNNTGILPPESQGKLRITGMILQEVLRLYPPAPYYSGEATARHELGKITVLPGTVVNICLPLLHHSHKHWEAPLEFKPERFEHGIPGYGHTFQAFGGGPRICIGLNFAMMEAKTLLALLLHNFVFDVSPSYRHLPGRNGLTSSSAVRLLVHSSSLP